MRAAGAGTGIGVIHFMVSRRVRMMQATASPRAR